MVSVLILFSGPGPVSSQTPDSLLIGDCHELPRELYSPAEEFLEVGNVRAKILNAGSLFWNGGQNVYEIPRGSGVNAEFVVNLVVGGEVDDSLRIAGNEFGPYEFWPGVIDDEGMPTRDCIRHNRLWKIDRDDDIRPARDSMRITPAVSDWPVELGAPFLDSDGDGSYNPASGDLPRMLGDQMVWWVMNDRGGRHERYGTLPLGVEVRGAAYGFDDAGPISNTTFYRYEITNRNDAPIDSFFVAWFRDVDLGSAFDDYIGTDTTLGIAYSYNADNDDDGNYGEAPPANGFLILQSDNCLGRYARLSLPGDIACWTEGLSAHLTFFDCCSVLGASPRRVSGWHHFLNGRWQDGSPLSASDYWASEDVPEDLKFMYPGDPVTGSWWSEINSDGEGGANQPADRRSIGGSRSRPLQPGETRVITFALIWSRGSSNLDSVSELRNDALAVRQASDIWVAPVDSRVDPVPDQLGPDIPFAASLYPNPASHRAQLRLGIPRAMNVQIDVHDVLGRWIADVVDAHLDAGDRRFTLPTADWPPGVYLIRIQVDHITETRSLVVRR